MIHIFYIPTIAVLLLLIIYTILFVPYLSRVRLYSLQRCFLLVKLG